MYVLINGAFGIGKTAVARELRRLLPGAAIFDPERVGFVLKRLPGYSLSDFQHLAAWRRVTVLGGRAAGLVRRTVIIPIALSEPSYLDEIRGGLTLGGRPVLHFCLTAPLEVVRDRLAGRGEPLHDPRWSWVHRRASECCRAHEGARFAVQVPTAGALPADIAAEIASRVRGERLPV